MIKIGKAYQFFYANDEGVTSFEKGIIEQLNDTEVLLNGRTFSKERMVKVEEIYKDLEELKDEDSETCGAYYKISFGPMEACYEIYPLGNGKTAYILYQNGNFNVKRAAYLTEEIKQSILDYYEKQKKLIATHTLVIGN